MNVMNNNGKKLFDVIKRFRKITRSDNFFEDMSLNEIMVCSILMREEKENNQSMIQAKDLSEKMKISRPALNNIINKLEDKELVERVRTKNNRKAVYIKLTNKSNEIYQREQENFIILLNNIVNKMGEEDTVNLINLLEKLYTIMEEEVK